MKKTVKLNETELIGVVRNIIKEARGLLNEGPGAGYKMTFEGLSASDVQLNGNKFTAKLQQKPIKWSAEAAYWSVSSEGVYYDGQLWEEFDNETNMVIGGEVSGYIDSDEFAGTEEDLQELNDELSDFGFEDMVGGGYVHTNLANPMGFGGGTNEVLTNLGSYGDIVIDYVAIEAPGIVQTVNWMADNWHRLEDEYYGDQESGALNESFENSELAQMVAEHGGLEKQRWAFDSRNHSLNMDLRLAKPVGYIPPEAMEYINMLNKFVPISEQVLMCKDGGMIVVEKGEEPMKSPYNSEYMDKIHNRTNNYLDDKGREKNPYMGAKPWDNKERRNAHLDRRGKPTKGLEESIDDYEIPEWSDFWKDILAQVCDLAIYLDDNVPEEVTDEYLKQEFIDDLDAKGIKVGNECSYDDWDEIKETYKALKEKYHIEDPSELDPGDFSDLEDPLHGCTPDGFASDRDYYRWRYGE